MRCTKRYHCLSERRGHDLDVSVLLCIFSTTIQRCSTYKLWLMKDYGILDPSDYSGIILTIRPRYRFTNGEVLLRCLDMEGIVFMTSKGRVGLWPRLEDGFVSVETKVRGRLVVVRVVHALIM